MPKIETTRSLFFSLLEQPPSSTNELAQALTVAKAELDHYAEDSSVIKFELNDTNRPDLWSAAGLARQLNSYRVASRDWGIRAAQRYSFFSTVDRPQSYGERHIVVEKELQKIRPFIVAFELRGSPLDEARLAELIQCQEKICANFGRKRRAIAMGIYNATRLSYPLHYRAAHPTENSFIPLDMDREYNLREILKEHPKGQEYGHIIAHQARFPLVVDQQGQVLSMPPIINSNDVGNVQVGDDQLLVELTGGDLQLLITAANVVACDCADLGFEILPVATHLPYDSELGRQMVSPFNRARQIDLKLDEASHRLGRAINAQEAEQSLCRMGFEVQAVDQQQGRITVIQPPWRNDCMHAVDLIEDIMIGCGIDSFQPLPPTDFTVGRLLPVEEQGRKIVSIMMGLGFQEMMFNYLVSGVDFIEKMYPAAKWPAIRAEMVAIANPLSEKYSYLRNSIIPNLLAVEGASANAVYPHHIFEVGKVARRAATANYGSLTSSMLGFLSAINHEGFSAINERISALMYYLKIDYHLQRSSDSRFLPGRCAEIIIEEQSRGIFGELHPQLLSNWNIETPCTAAEFLFGTHME